MTQLTWDDLLDDFEDLLDECNDALDTGRLPDFNPADQIPPLDKPTQGHRERMLELEAASDLVARRLTEAMKANQAERTNGRDRISAHREYSSKSFGGT